MSPAEWLVAGVGGVAFPVAIAWVLLRWVLTKTSASIEDMNGKLDRLADAVERNTDVMLRFLSNRQEDGSDSTG